MSQLQVPVHDTRQKSREQYANGHHGCEYNRAKVLHSIEDEQLSDGRTHAKEDDVQRQLRVRVHKGEGIVQLLFMNQCDEGKHG